MKKIISGVTMLFFLMLPTFLLSESIDGSAPTGQDSTVKADKVVKKAPRLKKAIRRVPKKNKHAKMKAMRSTKPNKPSKEMDSMPAHQ